MTLNPSDSPGLHRSRENDVEFSEAVKPINQRNGLEWCIQLGAQLGNFRSLVSGYVNFEYNGNFTPKLLRMMLPYMVVNSWRR